MNRPTTLLDDALSFDDGESNSRRPQNGRVVLVEDCVETSGAFVLHHLIKRFLSPNVSSSDSIVLFVAFAQPFSHYDRILRKMGCNLAAQRENKRLLFFDMLMLECPGENIRYLSYQGLTMLGCPAGAFALDIEPPLESLIDFICSKLDDDVEGGLIALFGNIQKAVEVNSSNKNITIVIDDISLLEVATNGSTKDVLNFMRYCHTLTTQFGCTIIIVLHEDIYSSGDGFTFPLQLEYLADIIIKTEPLITGLAADVHGQLTVLNKGTLDGFRSSKGKIHNFHYKIKENSVDYFYPGSRS